MPVSKPRKTAAKKAGAANLRVARPPADIDDPIFDLDAVAAEAEGSPFWFFKGGKTISLPNLGGLDYREIIKAETGSVEAIRNLLSAAMDEDDWTHFDALPTGIVELNALFKKWREHAGLGEGE
jgi:hypothetical protein